ncbi:MAG: M15 family peptidase, partial [Betaproteobacteria bacterium]|nr:M15 family peptidase [Betaproteobacteria bacterium]
KLQEHQAAFLLDMCKLIQHATDQGFVVTGGELWRTPEQQKVYVQTGRSKTLKSKHLDRLAIDLNIFRDGKLCSVYEIEPLGDYWESLSPMNRWGGRFSKLKDGPHFERNI